MTPRTLVMSAVLWLAWSALAAPSHAQSFIPGSSFDTTVPYNPDDDGELTLNGVPFTLPSSLVPDASFDTQFRLTTAGDVLYARKFSTGTALVVRLITPPPNSPG